ncbi:tetratricopeptide repeat protein [Magnetococcales bacterium HHB-1]
MENEIKKPPPSEIAIAVAFGFWLIQNKKEDLALRLLVVFLSSHIADNPLITYYVAMLMRFQGKEEKSQNLMKKAFTQLSKTNPESNPLNYFNQVSSLFPTTKEGLDQLTENIQNNPYNGLNHFLLGMFHIAQEEREKALPSLETAVALEPHKENYHRTLGSCLYRLHRYSEAEDAYTKAGQQAPDNYAIFERLALIRELRKNIPGCCTALSSVAQYHQSESSTTQAILLCALPKSAGTFIANGLAMTLDKPIQIKKPTCDNGIFPDQVLCHEALKIYAKGANVIFNHADSRDNNLAAIENAGFKDILVHIRDPRQSLHSYHYHCRSGRGLMRNRAANVDYPDLPEEERRHWLMKNYFEYQVLWIQNWLKVWKEQQRLSFNIHLSSFDQFLAEGAEPFLANRCQALNFHPETIHVPPKSAKVRFRKGDPKAWRHAFNDEEKAWMWQRIPQEIANQFGWEP